MEENCLKYIGCPYCGMIALRPMDCHVEVVFSGDLDLELNDTVWQAFTCDVCERDVILERNAVENS